jgi:hypothetical protein
MQILNSASAAILSIATKALSVSRASNSHVTMTSARGGRKHLLKVKVSWRQRFIPSGSLLLIDEFSFAKD